MLKRTLQALTCTMLVAASPLTTLYAEDSQTTEVDMPKLSETFGNLLGKNMKDSGFDFEIEDVITGIRKGVKNQPAPLSNDEYQNMMMIIQQKAFQKLSDDNLKKAEAFMEENSTNSGVITIESGKLQYQVLQEGNGATVTSEDSPLINYTGQYADGTVFSTSEETGGPITIPLKHTIPGFNKGISGMKEGEKRRLFIHPDEGYGSSAAHLPPNSLLIFDIEVIAAKSTDSDDDSDEDDSELDIDDEDSFSQ